MKHPKQLLLDHIWNSGHTPRLLIDAQHANVAMPQHIKEQGGARLIIDLKASDPLDIDFNETGVSVTLAFKGHVERCMIPWNRIYTIIDRESGKAFAFPDHAPLSPEAPTFIDRGRSGTRVGPAPDEMKEAAVTEAHWKGLRLIKGGKA